MYINNFECSNLEICTYHLCEWPKWIEMHHRWYADSLDAQNSNAKNRINWTPNIKHSSVRASMLSNEAHIRNANKLRHKQIERMNVNRFNTLIDCCYAFRLAQYHIFVINMV